MYRLLHLLEKKVGPFTVYEWAVMSAAVAYGWSIFGPSVSAYEVKEADRLAQRVKSWRGFSDELADALVEPLADALAGALSRRGAFLMHARRTASELEGEELH